eukprot:3107625-Pleurochrysis_carterae.AAC.1
MPNFSRLSQISRGRASLKVRLRGCGSKLEQPRYDFVSGACETVQGRKVSCELRLSAETRRAENRQPHDSNGSKSLCARHVAIGNSSKRVERKGSCAGFVRAARVGRSQLCRIQS